MFVAGFQYVAFQSPSNDNGWLGGGYIHPHIKYQDEEAKRQQIRKEKSELEKLESVLRETERKKQLAAQNQILATERRAVALARLEAEYLAEINRLLMVRAELIRRIAEDEAILIIMIMKRRRLRVA